MNNDPSPLKISKLTKNYGTLAAIKDINLELQRGEVFGFLGPNGAGKSTTIRTILNFLRPSAGKIEVFGMESVSSSKNIMRVTGYLAGDIALYEQMSGRQMLTYLSSLRNNTDWQYVDKLVDKLQATLDKPIKSLSKGNKQKIGLIQAFMSRPELIILDEPTSGLDPLMKQTFYEIVREASRNGSTIFLSSHDLTEVQKICQRVGFIRNGALVAIEDIAKVGDLNFKSYIANFSVAPSAQELANLPGVKNFKTNRNQVEFAVAGNIGDFIRALSTYSLTDLESKEIALEDLFMHYYQKEEDATNE